MGKEETKTSLFHQSRFLNLNVYPKKDGKKQHNASRYEKSHPSQKQEAINMKNDALYSNFSSPLVLLTNLSICITRYRGKTPKLYAPRVFVSFMPSLYFPPFHHQANQTKNQRKKEPPIKERLIIHAALRLFENTSSVVYCTRKKKRIKKTPPAPFGCELKWVCKE